MSSPDPLKPENIDLAAIADALSSSLHGSVARERIDATLQGLLEKHLREATVLSYRPIILQREARDALRQDPSQ